MVAGFSWKLFFNLDIHYEIFYVPYLFYKLFYAIGPQTTDITFDFGFSHKCVA